MSERKPYFYLVTLVALVVFNFLMPRMLPGSPVRHILGEEAAGLTTQERDRIVKEYNLDQPLWNQFLTYVLNLVRLEWGDSFSRKLPIRRVIFSALPWTFLLCGCGLAVAAPLGCFLGTRSAFLRKRRKDLKLLLLNTALTSLPIFWIGLVLIAVFGVWLGVLPTFGARSVWSDLYGPAYLADIVRHLILPVTTLALSGIMPYFLTMRQSVMKIMNEDFVLMARIRRLPEGLINCRYIYRNAILPVFTLLMLDLAYLFSGSVVVETVFAYPGLGRIMYEAVLSRDYPLIQYGFLVSSVLVVGLSLLADRLYHLIDPRLRVS
jgi:peptide/nickel transport system permease protein